jgi:hypothetical protein
MALTKLTRCRRHAELKLLFTQVEQLLIQVVYRLLN